MKELSIEEKAKAYDEAVSKSIEFYTLCKKCGDKETVDFLEDIFSELKESEDERIRKELIEFIKSRGGFKQKYIDWLEHIKQSWYKEGFIDGKYSGVTSKELSTNDAVTLKELIDFLENGTAKLQHDLTRYANWLKIKFTPIEKQGKQKPAEWSEEDEEMIDEIIDYMKPMPIFFESTKGKSGKEYTKEFIKNAAKWLSRLKYRVQLQKNLIATDEEFVQAKKDAYNDALD